MYQVRVKGMHRRKREQLNGVRMHNRERTVETGGEVYSTPGRVIFMAIFEVSM